jgi:hypothetical protein
MEVHLEVLLELIFCTQPPNFGVEAHIEAPTGVALNRPPFCLLLQIPPPTLHFPFKRGTHHFLSFFPTQPPIISLPCGVTVASAVVRCLQASPPPSPLFPPLPLRPPSALPSARHPLPCIRGCTGSGRKCWRAGCGGHGGPRPSLFRRSLPRGVLPWLTPAATDHCAYAAVRI